MKRLAVTSIALLLVLLSAVTAAAAPMERFNMSYIYFGSPDAFFEKVDKAEQALSLISPTYFDIDQNGNLLISDKMNEKFVSQMHRRGIKVAPFLSNHWDREKGRAALRNSEALAEQIVDAVERYDLDGVNVDLENLTEADREQYVEFVRLLSKKMPRNAEISVAVAANPDGRSVGWQGSYDYEALGRYSDYLVIMAYDETWEGFTSPGPVASIPFVENSIKYALKKVPAGKIVLGIPFYGRYWRRGDSYGGYGIHMNKAKELVDRYNGKAVFNEDLGSVSATVTLNSREQRPVLLGQQLKPGTYEIWYENDRSIQYKLRLVQKYNLKGTASWSLGQETEDTWDYYSEWLNGDWFVDTKDHWARESITNMEHMEWMQGISSTHFAPDKPLTRAQSATILVRALNIETGRSKAPYFSDVSASHWALEYIEAARREGIMMGTGSNTFGPENPLTREQMAVMLHRILGDEYQDVEGVRFKDIEPGRWSYEAINVMTGAGIFRGFEDGTFRPEEAISRAQMAAIMDRLSNEFIRA
jgi:spore germination protein YaaH